MRSGDLCRTPYSDPFGQRVAIMVGETGLGDRIFELVLLHDRGVVSIRPRRTYSTARAALDAARDTFGGA
jgi:hypothetical protein